MEDEEDDETAKYWVISARLSMTKTSKGPLSRHRSTENSRGGRVGDSSMPHCDTDKFVPRSRISDDEAWV